MSEVEALRQKLAEKERELAAVSTPVLLQGEDITAAWKDAISHHIRDLRHQLRALEARQSTDA